MYTKKGAAKPFVSGLMKLLVASYLAEMSAEMPQSTKKEITPMVTPMSAERPHFQVSART